MPVETTARPARPSDSATRSDTYKWWVIVMLWFVTFFNYADRQAIASVLPLIEKELHLDLADIGWIFGAFACVYGLSSPITGLIADRIRRKVAILGGLEIWSVICTATALARTFPQLLFFRGAIGLGESIYFPAAMSLVGDYHGKKTRSFAMGFHQTSVYIGTIGGSFFAAVIGQKYGWRWSFIVFGVLGMFLGVVLFKFLKEPKRGAAEDVVCDTSRVPSSARNRLGLLEFLRIVRTTPTVLLLMGAFICANFVAYVLLSWMPKFLHDKFDFSLPMAGLTATLYVQLASMAGAPFGGWLADKLRFRWLGGRIGVQALGVFCGAPFVFLSGQTHSFAMLITTLTAWGLFKGFYDASIFASVYEVIRPEARGVAAGFMNCVGWSGAAIAPVAVGYVALHTNLGLAISLTAFLYLLAGTLLIAAILFTLNTDSARMQQRPAPSAI